MNSLTGLGTTVSINILGRVSQNAKENVSPVLLA